MVTSGVLASAYRDHPTQKPASRPSSVEAPPGAKNPVTTTKPTPRPATPASAEIPPLGPTEAAGPRDTSVPHRAELALPGGSATRSPPPHSPPVPGGSGAFAGQGATSKPAPAPTTAPSPPPTVSHTAGIIVAGVGRCFEKALNVRICASFDVGRKGRATLFSVSHT